MTTRTASADLPTPYIGQVVHYVTNRGEHQPVHVTRILRIDDAEPEDNHNPIMFAHIDNSARVETTGPLGVQQSADALMGTWHEITAACAQKVTEVEANPSR